jgi:hypothetical protein
MIYNKPIEQTCETCNKSKNLTLFPYKELPSERSERMKLNDFKWDKIMVNNVGINVYYFKSCTTCMNKYPELFKTSPQKRYYEKKGVNVKKAHYEQNMETLKNTECSCCGTKERSRYHYKGVKNGKHIVYNTNVSPVYLELKKAKVICSGCLYDWNAELKEEYRRKRLGIDGIHV